MSPSSPQPIHKLKKNRDRSVPPAYGYELIMMPQPPDPARSRPTGAVCFRGTGTMRTEINNLPLMNTKDDMQIRL